MGISGDIRCYESNAAARYPPLPATCFQDSIAPSPANRLASLRMQGCAIQQRIAETPKASSQQGHAWPQMEEQNTHAAGSTFNSRSPTSWPEVTPSPHCVQGSFSGSPAQFCMPPPTRPPNIEAPKMGTLPASIPPPSYTPAPELASMLRLSAAVHPPELGTSDLPSLGSMLHHRGECKPCSFFHTNRCTSKELCQFCHL